MDERSCAGAPVAAALPARRAFLIQAAASGFTLALVPALAAPGASPAQGYAPTLWYRIDREGIVTVYVTRAEMGQHVGSALARIVAEELEADWADVRVEHVDSDPRWGEMVTGGSASVFEGYTTLGRAGAAGRLALVAEGARLLGVPAAACRARNSRVECAQGSLSYAEIVRRGNLAREVTPEELAALPLKPASERRLLGSLRAALDIPDKTNGRARYGIDAEVPGMVYGRPKIPPTRNSSRVVGVDDRAARQIKGYLRSVVLEDPSHTVPGWVVVLADSYATAMRAADAVQVHWVSDGSARVSEEDVLAHGAWQIADAHGGARVVDDAGVDEAFARAERVVEGQYTTASALHFALEPVNALAVPDRGRWEIHAGNQWQTLAIPLLAKALRVPPEHIVLRTYRLGGGFGRRLNGDYLVPAALAAKAQRRPVKLICTREDDSRFDSFRSPSIQKLRMALDGRGKVLAMEHHASAGWPNLVMAPDTLAKTAAGVPYDPDAIGGADHWYSVGAQRVRALSNDLANRAFRPGWLRSVGAGWTHWALESFLDEVAAQLHRDPLEFRLALLDGQGRNADGAARLAAVLRRTAARSGWGRALPAGTALGIAASSGQSRDMPTWVACVAQVRVDRDSGRITLERLTITVDAGTIVDPDGALAQVEGGALWGVSLALHEGTRFVAGQVHDTNLDGYTPLRMSDVPALDIAFVESDAPPSGLGEPPTTVVAPAIGNAICAATGVRLRKLPMRASDLLQALPARQPAAPAT